MALKKLSKILIVNLLFCMQSACSETTSIQIEHEKGVNPPVTKNTPKVFLDKSTDLKKDYLEVVKLLYADTSYNKEQSSFIDFPPQKLHEFFTEELSMLILEEANCVKDGYICNLDFDPLFDSQDPSPEKLVFTKLQNKVIVSFSEQGKSKKIVYLLTNNNGEYKINNILYKNGFDLKSILSKMP